jgi:hypothetical protein
MATAPDPTSWHLLDAVEQAAAHPRSFFIPDAGTRERLQPGDHAKLVFQLAEEPEDGPGAERMWVEVTDRAPGGYVGRLANAPVVVTELAEGARVEFEPRHVVQVPADADDPYENQVAFVSERVFDDDDPGIGVATYDPEDAGRPVADGRRLSGWSLLAGDETEEYTTDPERIRLPSLPWLLERHPELRPLLDAHDGSEASYVLEEGTFRRV